MHSSQWVRPARAFFGRPLERTDAHASGLKGPPDASTAPLRHPFSRPLRARATGSGPIAGLLGGVPSRRYRRLGAPDRGPTTVRGGQVSDVPVLRWVGADDRDGATPLSFAVSPASRFRVRYVPRMERLPALYLGHGAPPLLEDPVWPVELRAWSERLPRPTAILIVSAHWESAPVTVGATTPVPLTYDFYGFPLRYYQMRYDAPVAPDLAAKVAGAHAGPRGGRPGSRRAASTTARSCRSWRCTPRPTSPSSRCRCRTSTRRTSSRSASGWRRSRDEGVLIIGSGFMTHGLPFIHEYMAHRQAAARRHGRATSTCGRAEALARRDLDALFDFRQRAPGHALRASDGRALRAARSWRWVPRPCPDAPPSFTIDGYWYGLAKRSFEVG